jgi:hypothetical protein
LWKLDTLIEQMKNSLNSVSTCLRVVDTRRARRREAEHSFLPKGNNHIGLPAPFDGPIAWQLRRETSVEGHPKDRRNPPDRSAGFLAGLPHDELSLRMETVAMTLTGLSVEIPEALIHDFASDPLAPFDKLLKKCSEQSWPLHSELSEFLKSLQPQAIEKAYEDATFVGLYGKSDHLARVWIAERLLIEESARRLLESLTESPASDKMMPYTAECLRDIKVDGESMVRLSDFVYNNSTLATCGYSFTVCSTTESPNSTYWLPRSFYEQGVAKNVRVRLDPFLWGSSDSYPQLLWPRGSLGLPAAGRRLAQGRVGRYKGA